MSWAVIAAGSLCKVYLPNSFAELGTELIFESECNGRSLGAHPKQTSGDHADDLARGLSERNILTDMIEV